MPLIPEPDYKRITRWYFGGIAATVAHVFVYPLDVLKVGLQTEQIMEKITAYRYARYIFETQGLLAFYSGLSAGLRQQFTHSIVRFGVYYKLKESLQMKEVPLIVDLFLTAGSGACGAILKNPIDIIGTRMKIDLKREPHYRYNYKSISQALDFILMTEGYRALFLGVELNLMKSIAFTCCQICVYEHFKMHLTRRYQRKDQTLTHVMASAVAGIVATFICQPIEVVKVRYMTRSHKYNNVWEVFKRQKHLGMLGFYRGILLSFIKIEIQTIITFVLIEKLRLYYGLTPKVCARERDAKIKDCIIVKRPKIVQPPGYFDRLWRLIDVITMYISTVPVLRYLGWLFSFLKRAPPPEPEMPAEDEGEIETPWMRTKKRLKRRLWKLGKLLMFLIYKSLEKHHKDHDIVVEVIEIKDEDEDVEEERVEERPVLKSKRNYDELQRIEKEEEEEEEVEYTEEDPPETGDSDVNLEELEGAENAFKE